MANDFANQDYLSGNAITSEMEWIYSTAPVTNSRFLHYIFIFINSPPLDAVDELSPNHAINYEFRTYIHGSTNQALLLADNSSGCLRVLDKTLTPVQPLLTSIPRRC